MPIYNGLEFIDESVGSIIDQTFDKWELLIGINGHDKNSSVLKIAQKYELMDTRIRVFDLLNIKGKANALNEMIKYSKYNLIALLDVDDIWHHKKLEIQKNYLLDWDVVGSQCIYFGDLNNIRPNIPMGDITSHNFILGNPIINSSVIIKKELCLWVENGIEDYELWLRLWKNGKTFFNVDANLVMHRIHKNSAFNSAGHKEQLSTLLQKIEADML